MNRSTNRKASAAVAAEAIVTAAVETTAAAKAVPAAARQLENEQQQQHCGDHCENAFGFVALSGLCKNMTALLEKATLNRNNT